MKRRTLDFICAALIGAGALVLSPVHRALVGANDFAHLYAGGRLSGTPDLYSRQANEAVERPLIGGVLEGSRFMRPPFVCLFLKPLSLLSYRAAYWLFQAGNLAALLLFLFLVRGRWPEAGTMLVMSAPVLGAFINGQELPMLIACAMGSLWLARRGHDFAGGVLLALCASKPHLFLLVPLVLLLYRRWRFAAGAAVSFLLLNAAATLIAGPDVIGAFLRMLREPGGSPWPGIMPSVRAIAGTNGTLFAALAGIVFVLTVAAIVRTGSFEAAFAFALIGSLLMSPHAYMQDAITVLPAAAILLPALTAGAMRTFLRLALLPFPYYILFLGPPGSFLVPVLLGGVVVAGSLTRGAARKESAVPMAEVIQESA